MAKSKTFNVTHSYQLRKVDSWWASLLRQGTKEIVGVEWEALGQMMWRLRLTWQPINSGMKLNVGHPEYMEFTTEELEGILLDTLGSFEAAYSDLNIFEAKVKQWQLSETSVVAHGETEPKLEVSFSEDLDEAEQLMAMEYLWPTYKNVQRAVSYYVAQMQELEAEVQARKAEDYFSVTVDRGMLRRAFVEQIGYDNDWLFESQEEQPPVSEEE